LIWKYFENDGNKYNCRFEGCEYSFEIKGEDYYLNNKGIIYNTLWRHFKKDHSATYELKFGSNTIKVKLILYLYMSASNLEFRSIWNLLADLKST
jgi:hypothetical protein